jgi:carboxylesterase
VIEINERFEVAATPAEVYAVLSDPHAVVECVAGAALGDSHEDGSFDGSITVKFSALRVSFKGQVSLELDEENRRGVMKARGKDGQGGTRFQCEATFEVTSEDGGATSVVTAKGDVDLSGKLASVIEGAATAVVRRMTNDFVTALSVRCASGSAQLGPSAASNPPASNAPASNAPASNAPVPEVVTSEAPAAEAVHVAQSSIGDAGSPEPPAPVAAVLLLHGFGASPSNLRPWGEALAAAGLAVSIPRLPGHGTRWQELNKTTSEDWYRAAEEALTTLRKDHDRVFVMGVSLGATLGLRLAERRGNDLAGVVAVNPVAVGLANAPKFLGLLRRFIGSRPGATSDVKRSGVADVGYGRIPLQAAYALRELAATTTSDLGLVRTPVLLVSSRVDHLVAPTDGDLVWAGIPTVDRRRITYTDSYHVVPLDNDAQALFSESISFVHGHALVEVP